MKLNLHLQTRKKKFIDIQYDDQTLVKKMVDSLLEDNFVPMINNVKLFSKDLVVLIHDDTVISGDSDNTLKQSNIVDGEHIYLLERSAYFEAGTMKLFIKPVVDGNHFTLDNISSSQTMYSVAKLRQSSDSSHQINKCALFSVLTEFGGLSDVNIPKEDLKMITPNIRSFSCHTGSRAYEYMVENGMDSLKYLKYQPIQFIANAIVLNYLGSLAKVKNLKVMELYSSCSVDSFNRIETLLQVQQKLQSLQDFQQTKY
ncbi:hypothetical protein PPL_03204 [Heterostelium album PN500]|uniref:Uncharacterized protein n=1 Tax=Heterostelium pallidum (strain ATCC 26659 / Pp 5 / PN500) TaxID=670386 RepID=D3B483_HETP5|nr:hypothetical protein PPL_03204 [Heterostelium album PN500]EFA84131.1 hypothetical protein PPL_03204 [Heterostelium album PN500]|eukprot:XP_020436248.1 hypothetical protein PPL_03204 [Heterostelium album PN500]